MTECSQLHIPYTLCYDSEPMLSSPTSSEGASPKCLLDDVAKGDTCTVFANANRVIVQEATLLAEFKQLKPLQNARVTELENFYNSEVFKYIIMLFTKIIKCTLFNAINNNNSIFIYLINIKFNMTYKNNSY